jgi:hypothetical protein
MCNFPPPPQFFNDDNPADSQLLPPSKTNDSPWLIYQATTPTSSNHALCPIANKSRESEQARTAREDAKYNALPETAQIDIADGDVTFCQKFKYLGSRISYNLRNDDNIAARLSTANKSMGALKEIWQNPHLNTYSKYLLFRAIPVNLLLWGCETWSLQQAHLCRLEVFLHCSICCILHISILDVKDKHIHNKKI